MGFANLWLGRSASRLASSVCGGRVRSISTVFNRPPLVHNPCPHHPFVSYSTAAIDDDWTSSEQAVLQEIDSEINEPVMINRNNLLETWSLSIWKNRSLGMTPPPASFPFKIEDIPGNRTVTLTREYNGEHIQVVVSMPLSTLSDDDDTPPSIESIDDHDYDPIPLVVTLTKKSGRSLEFRCRVYSHEISIDEIHVNLPGDSSQDPKVIRDMDDIVGMDHEDLKETFNKYLKVRGLERSTLLNIRSYMVDKMKEEYWLWLDNVKDFLEE